MQYAHPVERLVCCDILLSNFKACIVTTIYVSKITLANFKADILYPDIEKMNSYWMLVRFRVLRNEYVVAYRAYDTTRHKHASNSSKYRHTISTVFLTAIQKRYRIRYTEYLNTIERQHWLQRTQTQDQFWPKFEHIKSLSASCRRRSLWRHPPLASAPPAVHAPPTARLVEPSNCQK